jgi:hypothetical protein
MKLAILLSVLVLTFFGEQKTFAQEQAQVQPQDDMQTQPNTMTEQPEAVRVPSEEMRQPASEDNYQKAAMQEGGVITNINSAPVTNESGQNP